MNLFVLYNYWSQEVCDHICKEAKQIFALTKNLKAAKLFYQEYFPNYYKKLSIYEMKESCNIYSDLVRDKLEKE